MQARPAGARLAAALSCAELDRVVTDGTGRVGVRPNTNVKPTTKPTTTKTTDSRIT
jgi:hypothetical protein